MWNIDKRWTDWRINDSAATLAPLFVMSTVAMQSRVNQMWVHHLQNLITNRHVHDNTDLERMNACLLSRQTGQVVASHKNNLSTCASWTRGKCESGPIECPDPRGLDSSLVFQPAPSFPCVCILGTQEWLLRTSDSPLTPYTPTSHPCCFFHHPDPATWLKLQGSPLWKYLVEKGKISGPNTESVYWAMMTYSLYKYKILVKKPSLSCCLVFF